MLWWKVRRLHTERGHVVVGSEKGLTSTVICGPEVGVVVGPVEGEGGREGGVPS